MIMSCASLFMIFLMSLMSLMKGNRLARTINLFVQEFIFYCLVLALLTCVFAIDHLEVHEEICESSPSLYTGGKGDEKTTFRDMGDCKRFVRIYLYCAWALLSAAAISTQLLVVRFFESYRDEAEEMGNMPREKHK